MASVRCTSTRKPLSQSSVTRMFSSSVRPHLRSFTSVQVTGATANDLVHAASLNYRDLIIPGDTYPLAVKENVVPGSDGAGEVVAVGSRVTRFRVGDKVATLFHQAHISGRLDKHIVTTALGGAMDGTLRQYGAFDQEGLVHIPKNLGWLEAATLSCAALTAWNSLYGNEGKMLKQGDWVLTQGTGGVSMFALQVRLHSYETTLDGSAVFTMAAFQHEKKELTNHPSLPSVLVLRSSRLPRLRRKPTS